MPLSLLSFCVTAVAGIIIQVLVSHVVGNAMLLRGYFKLPTLRVVPDFEIYDEIFEMLDSRLDKPGLAELRATRREAADDANA